MGLSGTGRSQEPGSGEVSDLGWGEGPELAVIVWAGCSQDGIVLLAGKGFLAGFTVSVPRQWMSPAGMGRAKVGELFLSPPPVLPSYFQKQAVLRQRK